MASDSVDNIAAASDAQLLLRMAKLIENLNHQAAEVQILRRDCAQRHPDNSN